MRKVLALVLLLSLTLTLACQEQMIAAFGSNSGITVVTTPRCEAIARQLAASLEREVVTVQYEKAYDVTLITTGDTNNQDSRKNIILIDYLEPLGFDCHRLVFSDNDTPDVANLYARLGDGAPNIGFAGHVDVVPVGADAAWTVDPFGGDIIDGRLYGRGAVDMKSAVAAFAVAASQYIGEFGRPAGSISLIITGDEEGPAVNGTRKMLQWMEAEGHRLDACLVGEPTSPQQLGDMIKIGRRGSMNFELTVTGTQGHTAYPHYADNPVHRLVAALDKLITTPLDEGTDHFEPSTLQVTSFDVGNPAVNVIPNEARAAFNVRYCDIYESKSLLAWVRERIREAGLPDEQLGIKTHLTGESFLTPPGQLSDTIAASIKEVTGVTAALGTAGGTSDARFIKDYCPVAEFGLVSQTMHKTDEWSSVADIENLTEIYRQFLLRYFAAERQ